MTETFLTTKQVADRLNVDTKTVLRYLQHGRLKGSKLGRDYRIPESAVNALLLPRNGTSGGKAGCIVTAIANQKGGVGKTTTTFNLGVALRRRGNRVLLVDLDPQASLTTSIGISPSQVPVSVYQALLDDDLDPTTLIHKTSTDVDLLPATIDLSAAEIELINMLQRELVLKDVLDKVRDQYDHILIDCPPSLGLLTINALSAADQVLIPMQCEFLATRGLALLLDTISKIKSRINRNLKIAGILPTMFDGRTTHANEVLGELRASFPGQVFNFVIKDTVRVKESPAAGLSILDYDPQHDATHSYLELAKEVDGRA